LDRGPYKRHFKRMEVPWTQSITAKTRDHYALKYLANRLEKRTHTESSPRKTPAEF